MIARLRSVRLTWPQIAMIAAASALATAVVIHAGTRRDHVPYTELSALRRRVVVHTSTPGRRRRSHAARAGAGEHAVGGGRQRLAGAELPGRRKAGRQARRRDRRLTRRAATTGQPTRAPA